MFGMGFTEILLIVVVAILFLGPDKLPQTMIEIAKFFKGVKRTVENAKHSIESELQVDEMRRELSSYKEDLTSASGELDRLTSLDELQHEINDIKKELEEDAPKQEKTPPPPPKPEVVTFKKSDKKQQKDEEA